MYSRNRLSDLFVIYTVAATMCAKLAKNGNEGQIPYTSFYLVQYMHIVERLTVISEE